MAQSVLADRIINAVQVALDVKGVSGSELARRLGVSQTYVWRRMTGEVSFSIDDLDRVAQALGISVEQLLPERVAA
jgi:transcriptional regulator with XRE-family HTH domain